MYSRQGEGGHSQWRDTLKLVQAHITKWRSGGWLSLWCEVRDKNKRLLLRLKKFRSNPAFQESIRSANTLRTCRAVEDGQFRKAIKSVSSVGFAPSSVDALNGMRSKHPSTLPPSPFPSPAPPPVQVSGLDVTKALRSFPSGSAPGPSCLRASHLKEAVFCPSPDFSSFVLVGVVNVLCRSRVARSILPHLCGATLLAKRRG